jgi:solute:Na+ symporter, SSS family
MQLAPIDIVVLIAYVVGLFGLAQYVSRGSRGAQQTSSDYFLASKSLPWWAIGASLIAANISAEQIVGMSGSGYAIGLAIASYEWMAALTLLIVGKFFLPVFLRNHIYTMPQFLEQRFGTRIRTLMAVFWLGLYTFVNLTSILWLGSIAVDRVTGVNQETVLVLLGGFALAYQFRGGLKAVALTDILQVTLLVAGGAAISLLTLGKIGGGAGAAAGFAKLMHAAPSHFHMILHKNDPFYKDLPGISVIIGGLWIMNLSYWGFNQYIIQRALAAKNLREAQKGILFAACLKLAIPAIIVLPGIAAVLLAPDLKRPDQAYPAMMALLPSGVLGLVFAALVAAVVASTASKINSIATIFTLDIWNQRRGTRSEAELVRVGRIAALLAISLAIMTARPLLGSFDQAFQFIQEYTGFFTPGIVVIFIVGLFWKRATEMAALFAAIGSFLLSLALKLAWPQLPFLDRVGWVFLATLLLAVVVSLLRPEQRSNNRIETADVDYSTSAGFAAGSVGVFIILAALYSLLW